MCYLLCLEKRDDQVYQVTYLTYSMYRKSQEFYLLCFSFQFRADISLNRVFPKCLSFLWDDPIGNCNLIQESNKYMNKKTQCWIIHNALNVKTGSRSSHCKKYLHFLKTKIQTTESNGFRLFSLGAWRLGLGCRAPCSLKRAVVVHERQRHSPFHQTLAHTALTYLRMMGPSCQRQTLHTPDPCRHVHTAI